MVLLLVMKVLVVVVVVRGCSIVVMVFEGTGCAAVVITEVVLLLHCFLALCLLYAYFMLTYFVHLGAT